MRIWRHTIRSANTHSLAGWQASPLRRVNTLAASLPPAQLPAVCCIRAWKWRIRCRLTKSHFSSACFWNLLAINQKVSFCQKLQPSYVSHRWSPRFILLVSTNLGSRPEIKRNLFSSDFQPTWDRFVAAPEICFQLLSLTIRTYTTDGIRIINCM